MENDTSVALRPSAPKAKRDSLTTVAQAGPRDVDEVSSVYSSYASAVRLVVRSICRNPADAEDAVQDTFLEVCRSIGDYRGDGSIWSWLRSVARSKALLHLRRERKHHALPLDSDGFGAGVLHEVAADPATLVDLSAVLREYDSLTRAVIWLHEVEGYSHREIGQVFGKSASFSKTRLSRALYSQLPESPY